MELYYKIKAIDDKIDGFAGKLKVQIYSWDVDENTLLELQNKLKQIEENYQIYLESKDDLEKAFLIKDINRKSYFTVDDSLSLSNLREIHSNVEKQQINKQKRQSDKYYDITKKYGYGAYKK